MQRLLPDSVQLALPEQWTDLPVDEREVREFLSQHVDPLKESLGAGTVRQIELAFARVWLLVKSQNVILASSYLAVDERDEGDDVPVLAGVTVSTLGREQIGTNLPLHEDVLLTAFTTSDDPSAAYDEIEPPSKTFINELPALRLLRLVSYTDERLGTLKQFVQTYLVPVASGDGVVVVSFSTVNFEYAKQFSELFEKIAGTLRILYPEDQTFEDEPKPKPSDQRGAAPA